MLETAVDNLRFGASMVFGRPFHLRSLERLVTAMRATQDEMGQVGAESVELLEGPALDEEARRVMQIGRLRRLAARAARETERYSPLLRAEGVDARHLTWDDWSRIPITTKAALRDDPEAFVSRSSNVSLRATTTGTTGRPTTVHFSEYEMRVMRALAAIYHLPRHWIEPSDLVHVAVNTRAVLGITALTSACAAVGASIHVAGLLKPEHTLSLLRERHQLAGKTARVSVLRTYPSYMGELVERARRLGYGPADFGLRSILTGGEILTEGLKRRAQEVFGPLSFDENFSMTELAPFGGNTCSHGHLHFEPSVGLIEVVGLEGAGPARDGEPGMLVATPLPPYRETTLLLRYATEDVVTAVRGRLECNLRHTPAAGRIRGRLRFAVQHDRGWTLPADVLDALEADEAVPLPARHGFWAVAGGVAVEVLSRTDDRRVHESISTRLLERGVPLRRLHLTTDRAGLRQPIPVRADLQETAWNSDPSADFAIRRSA